MASAQNDPASHSQVQTELEIEATTRIVKEKVEEIGETQ